MSNPRPRKRRDKEEWAAITLIERHFEGCEILDDQPNRSRIGPYGTYSIPESFPDESKRAMGEKS